MRMRPFLLCLLLVGCSAVDYDYAREQTSALPTGTTTTLDRRFAALEAGTSGTASASAGTGEAVSGFYSLVDGIDALSARLRFAEEAERSIDAQYYLIKRDRVGLAFLASLLAAADRGVRVRLLIDDMYNAGFDRDMLALDSHSHFEIRVFNPFNRGALGRTVGAAFQFPRINRRMHNKSFTVDNRVTIIGGRNIADEYFGAREDSAFGDLDVIGFGPVVRDVSTMFDRYWAHRTAVPLGGFTRESQAAKADLHDLRRRLAANGEALAGSPYARAVIDRAFRKVESDVADIRWSPYRLIYDSPDKGDRRRRKDTETIIDPLLESLSSLREELVIISPYFVPTSGLTEGLISAVDSGVDVAVITNSLAANNQKTVHGGYAPSRKKLLRAGIKLYEVRPDARVAGTEYVDASAARATLHTKSYVIDRREVFIGSFNFDPRSAYINTEMGVLINDPSLGEDYIAGLRENLPSVVWSVSLSADNRLQWTGLENNVEVNYDREPMTSWWERFKAGVYRLLPIRSQL